MDGFIGSDWYMPTARSGQGPSSRHADLVDPAGRACRQSRPPQDRRRQESGGPFDEALHQRGAPGVARQGLRLPVLGRPCRVCAQGAQGCFQQVHRRRRREGAQCRCAFTGRG